MTKTEKREQWRKTKKLVGKRNTAGTEYDRFVANLKNDTYKLNRRSTKSSREYRKTKYIEQTSRHNYDKMADYFATLMSNL